MLTRPVFWMVGILAFAIGAFAAFLEGKYRISKAMLVCQAFCLVMLACSV